MKGLMKLRSNSSMKMDERLSGLISRPGFASLAEVSFHRYRRIAAPICSATAMAKLISASVK